MISHLDQFWTSEEKSWPVTKRNGRWRVRVRRSGLPSLTKSFPTKTLALKWSQRVEYDPEKFLTEQLPEDHQLMTVGDLLRKYEKEVTPQKKGRDKEKYRLRILQKSTLSGVSLSKLKPHHITKFRVERLRVVSAGTVLKDLGLLSSSLGFTLILLTSSCFSASPMSSISL